MAKKTTQKSKQTENQNIEREYVIPLRKGFIQKPIYKKTPAAVKTIKRFLVRHMKIRDRDLNKIRINKYLNEYLWFRGIKKPPAKVKVRAVKEEAGTENEKVRVYLVDMPEKLKFKQQREEKLIQKSEEQAKEKESAKKASEVSGKATQEETEKDKTEKETSEKGSGEETKEESKKESEEEKEKKAAVEDSNLKSAKETHKKQKHTSGGKHKEKTAPKRQALKK